MALTYRPLTSVTVSGSTTHMVQITGIPATFTDLVLTGVGYGLTNDRSQRLQFNADTGSNYSLTSIRGNGVNTLTTRTSNDTSIPVNNNTTWSNSSSEPANWYCHINSYCNTAVFKTIFSRSGRVLGTGALGTEAVVGTWRSTAAISSISILYSSTSTNYFAAGTIFTLYGILGA